MARAELSRAQFSGLFEDPFFDQIITLNFRPERWVHNDHLLDLGPPSILKRIGGRAVQRLLFNYLINQSAFNFQEPLKRIILLPPEKLIRLLRIIGLSRRHKSLAKLIRGPARKEIVNCIGESAFLFLRTRVQFLVHEFPQHLIVDAESDPKLFIDACIHEGAAMLQLCLAHDDPAWGELLKLKLPSAKATVTLPQLGQKDRLRLQILVRKLTIDLEPECTNLLK